MTEVQNSAALVVGGSSGIGLATARQLADRGHAVHIVGRDAGRLASAAAAVPSAVTHQADAGDGAAMSAIASSIGTVDILVVAATGAEGIGPITELDVTMLRRAFDAKFWTHVVSIQAVLPYLTADGSITLVSAISARASMPGTAGVGAINAAVEGLVKPLAAELAPRRVNAVSPGFVDTPWWSGMPEADRVSYFEHAASVLPARHIAQADEIAEAIVLAATNRNITGTVIESDGGARLVTV
jgi:NAD(P)-dependent dehydrogenase (short-subunit alcohol dehydrogenase family)